MIRFTPARLTPASWLNRWISRSRPTSRALYRRPPPGARPGWTSPSRSYWRSVCGCMPAIRAATEMISTLASEVVSIERKTSSLFTQYRLLDVPARGRWQHIGQLVQGQPGLLRQLLRYHDVHRDQQVAGGAVAPGHALAAHPQGATAGRTGRHAHGHGAVERGYPQVDAVHRLREGDRHGQRQVV